MSKINIAGKELDREELTSFWLRSWASIATKEQYEAFKKMVEAMTDNELSKFVECLAKRAGKEITVKDFYATQKKLAERLSNEKTALGQVEPEFLNEEKNKNLLENIRRSRPSDSITLTSKQDKLLIDLWEDTGNKPKGRVFIPSDLFFTNTIPLLDCKIIVDERDIGGIECKSRVVIFQDYEERIRQSGENDITNVGAVVFPMETKTAVYGAITCPLYVVRGFDSILFGKFGWIGLQPELREFWKKRVSLETVSKMFGSMMETWYGIQIALLHPKVREVFAHPKTEKEEGENRPSKKKRKRAVRYIKKHIVGTEELETKIYGESKKKRHALVWYVIGHWRTYKNGTKVFVRPYWKGELRELKMNLEDREREIAI
jgi:hypothetical protein